MRNVQSGRTKLVGALLITSAIALAACSTTTDGAGAGPGPAHKAAPLHQLWKQDVGGKSGSEQQLVGGSADAKRVYVSDVSGHVYALDAKTGAVAWTHRAGKRTGVGVGLVGNRALFFDTDLGVFALDTDTGALVWSKQALNLPAGHAYDPAAARGILALKTSGGFSGVRLDSGKTAWTISEDKARFQFINPASDGKLLFAVASSGTGGGGDILVGLRPASGATAWSAPLPASSGAHTPVVVVYAVGRLVLVVSESFGQGLPPTLLAFDAATGKQRWTVAVAGPVTTRAAPIVVGDQLLFPTLKGILALAVSTGRTVFTTAMDTGGTTDEVGRCGTAACAVGLERLAVVDERGKIIKRVAVPSDAGRLITSPAGAVHLLSSSTVYGFG